MKLNIIDVRFDGQYTSRVMLGGKIIWQKNKDLPVYGHSKDRVVTQAIFRLPKLDILAGNDKVNVAGYSGAHLIEIDMAAGSSYESVELRGGAKLIRALLMAANQQKAVNTRGAADAVKINRGEGAGFILRISETGSGLRIKTLPVDGNEIENLIAKAAGGAPLVLAENGSYHTEVRTGAVSRAAYVADLSAVIKEKHGTKAVMIAVIPGESASVIKIATGENVTGRIFPVETIASSDIWSSSAEAFLRLPDLLDMAGKDSIKTGDYGNMIANDTELAGGYTVEQTDSKGRSKKLYAIEANGAEEKKLSADSRCVLWWLPVGDGEPIEEGSDMQTMDGNILMIQQAYQVIEHADTGILEVI